MAEGGEVSGGLEKCQTCLRKGRHNAVVKICDTCETSFCSACLVHHDAIFEHVQIKDAEANDGCTDTEESTELCDDHKMPITRYCKEENILGCETCMDVGHKHCKQVISLPLSATTLLQDVDVTDVNTLLDKTIQNLERIQLKQQSQMSTLIGDREKCLEDVNAYQTRLLERFNTIFRSTTDAIEHQFKILREEIERNALLIAQSLADVKSSRSRIQQFRDQHDQKFIEVKKGQAYIEKAEKVSEEAAYTLKIEGMGVAIDKRLDDVMTDLKSLATVMRRGQVEVKKTYQKDVSVKGDILKCNITSSCCLPDSSIVLVDYSNKRLKRLDGETLTITDTYSMKDNLRGVCCLDEMKAAITTCNQQLIIFAILPKLRPIRTLSLDHCCGYVGSYKGELFITDVDNTLYVYSMQGSLLRKITTDISGNRLFSSAWHVVVNDTGDKLFVTDWDKGLLMLNRHGIDVKKVDNKNFRGTRGVCLDDVGGAFVCGAIAKKVVYINQEGQHAVDVLTEADGLLSPRSVCFQVTRRRLFVSQEDSNQMIVCELI